MWNALSPDISRNANAFKKNVQIFTFRGLQVLIDTEIYVEFVLHYIFHFIEAL